MAPSFGRSISFQLSPSRSTAMARHVRSISLPCRSHPLLSHLHATTLAARAWSTTSPSSPSTGLVLVDALHAAVAELLLLPEPQTMLRRRAATSDSDRLLDAFLVLADAHRGFQETLLALRRAAADASLALLRRRDANPRLAAASRAQRRAEKDLARLAATVSSSSTAAVSRSARLSALAGATTTTAEEAEMAGALMDAVAASAAASAAVFSAVASASAAASSSGKKNSTNFAAAFVAKKLEAADVAPEKKLEELERCIDECESGSEAVFRSIVRTRVTLLNIRTPAI